MLLEKGLTMAFSQVQVFEAVGERSGVMGTGRWAAPCSACMYAAVAWWFASPLESLCSSRLVRTFSPVFSIFRATKTQQLECHSEFSLGGFLNGEKQVATNNYMFQEKTELDILSDFRASVHLCIINSSCSLLNFVFFNKWWKKKVVVQRFFSKLVLMPWHKMKKYDRSWCSC